MQQTICVVMSYSLVAWLAFPEQPAVAEPQCSLYRRTPTTDRKPQYSELVNRLHQWGLISNQDVLSFAIVVSVGAYGGAGGKGALKSATADSEAIVRLLMAQGYDQIYVLADEAATKANIGACVELAARTFARTAESKDVSRFVFYFSGHGEKGELLLLNERLGAKDIANWNEQLDSFRHRLFLVDACDVGTTVFSAAKGTLDAVADSQVRDAFRNRSAIGMAASRSNKLSFEPEGGGVSYFTAAFVAGAEGAADYTRDGIVTISELATFVRSDLLSKGMPAPIEPVLLDKTEGPQLFVVDGAVAPGAGPATCGEPTPESCARLAADQLAKTIPSRPRIAGSRIGHEIAGTESLLVSDGTPELGLHIECSVPPYGPKVASAIVGTNSATAATATCRSERPKFEMKGTIASSGRTTSEFSGLGVEAEYSAEIVSSLSCRGAALGSARTSFRLVWPIPMRLDSIDGTIWQDYTVSASIDASGLSVPCSFVLAKGRLEIPTKAGTLREDSWRFQPGDYVGKLSCLVESYSVQNCSEGDQRKRAGGSVDLLKTTVNLKLMILPRPKPALHTKF